MNISLESDSSEPNYREDQVQGRVPDSNKKGNNLDSWIDNFLVETGELEGKDSGESSETKLTSGEDVSAWAERILSGGSLDEEKRDGSQDHLSDGESDDIGNTLVYSLPASTISTIITSGDDDNDDQTIGDQSKTGDPESAQNSSSAILPTMNSDDGDDHDSDDGENGSDKEVLESSPYLRLHNEGDDFGIGTENENGSSRNPHDGPVSTPSPFNRKAPSTTSISTSSDDDNDNDGLGKYDGTKEEILESTPILDFDNDDDSSGIGIATNVSDGESDSSGDNRNELGPGTSLPRSHKKRSSTLITIISDDNNEPALSHEPEGESLEFTPVEPTENEKDSPEMGIADNKTNGESGNNGYAQSEHGPGTTHPPKNQRKRSATSITILSDDDEQAGEHEPESSLPIPVETGDNADDYPGIGIAGNTSDWDEIDLNSENEDQSDADSTSTGGLGSGDGAVGSVQGSRDPILPGRIGKVLVNNDSYFKLYFNFLYYLGLCPHNGYGKRACGILNYVLFAMNVLMALMHSVLSIKDIVISDKEEDVLLHLIRTGYDMNIFLFRLYHVFLITFKASSIEKVIKAAQDFGGRTSKLEIFLTIGSTLLTSLILGLTFPLVLIIASMPGKWDFEDVTLASSEDFAISWLTWNKENFKNESEYVWDTYGTGADITGTVVIFAVAGFVFGIIAFVHLFLTKDYSIVAAITMYKLCKEHTDDLDSTDSTTLTQETCQRLWERYKLLRTFSEELNDSHGFLFQLFHLDNALFSAYILYLQFTYGGSILLALLQFCVLAKVIIFYLLAAHGALVNDKLEKWAQSSFPGSNTLILENGEILTTSNLLHQLHKNPIGIGRGMFFINGAFLWKFTSVIGSFFVFFTENGQ